MACVSSPNTFAPPAFPPIVPTPDEAARALGQEARELAACLPFPQREATYGAAGRATASEQLAFRRGMP